MRMSIVRGNLYRLTLLQRWLCGFPRLEDTKALVCFQSIESAYHCHRVGQKGSIDRWRLGENGCQAENTYLRLDAYSRSK